MKVHLGLIFGLSFAGAVALYSGPAWSGVDAGLEACLDLRVDIALLAREIHDRDGSGLDALAERMLQGGYTPVVREQIARLVRSPDRDMSWAGIELLRQIGGRGGKPEAVELLTEVVRGGKDPFNRLEAVRTLAELGALEGDGPLAQEVIEVLDRMANRRRGPEKPGAFAAAQLLFDLFGGFQRHPIYDDVESIARFSKESRNPQFEEQVKDGGRNYLLGGAYAGKVIARVVPADSLTAWRVALGAHDLWRAKGFDHVPVEPIVSRDQLAREFPGAEPPQFKTGPGNAQVYARVLGMNVMSLLPWLPRRLKVDVQNQMYTIMGALEEMGIVHGHAHSRNFCVTFVDGKPRVYVIDFDAARLVKGSEATTFPDRR
ncbi:MAG TPA: hypothetical protein VM598_03480 [Bdellovibrionota bacterium]|nr:hypothetical protein [Bdellovibrionota bacterium]